MSRQTKDVSAKAGIYRCVDGGGSEVDTVITCLKTDSAIDTAGGIKGDDISGSTSAKTIRDRAGIEGNGVNTGTRNNRVNRTRAAAHQQGIISITEVKITCQRNA